MLERTVVVGLIAVALVAAWGLIRLWRQSRLRRLAAAPLAPELLPTLRPGRPAVLAFSTPGCAECRARQNPALGQLAARVGDHVQIAQLSAPEHPALVRRFGILTVPATVILDARGAVRRINLRYTDADRLQAQLNELGGTEA